MCQKQLEDLSNKNLLLIVSVYCNAVTLCKNYKTKFQHISESDPEEQPQADTHPTANITEVPGRRARGARERATHVRGQHSLTEQGTWFCVS